MNGLRTALAVALTLAATTVAARAEFVCGLDPYGDNFLSMRTGPGTRFPEIARLGENTALGVIGRRGSWLRVSTRVYGSGWVSRSYVCRGLPR
jgi:uncharacterized protein YraI